jgi:hypothetical protein
LERARNWQLIFKDGGGLQALPERWRPTTPLSKRTAVLAAEKAGPRNGRSLSPKAAATPSYMRWSMNCVDRGWIILAPGNVTDHRRGRGSLMTGSEKLLGDKGYDGGPSQVTSLRQGGIHP